MVYLSSSARIARLSFDSLELALEFIAARKLSQETVCVTDARGAVVYSQSFT